jgi:hypothetical protein
MTSRTRTNLLAASLILALLFSALAVKPVYADDNTPPATETPTSETATEGSATTAEAVTNEAPPVEEITTVETAPMQEATSEQAAPTDEGTTIETAPSQDVTTEQAAPMEEAISAPASEGTDIASTSELLADVPEGTDVVVVSDSGEVIPLATEQAAEIIAAGDPIWCPTGVTPTPGANGCTSTQAAFNGGLLPLLSGKTVNGTIWIASSYVGTTLLEGGAITLDGGSLGSTANYTLTVKGGWSGISGSSATNPVAPSTFNVPFSIIGWQADVTLSDLLFTGVTSGDALTVETSKKITLTRVQANNSIGGRGASLDNTALGAGIGDVVVTGSTFSDNSGRGLEVKSNGLITITDITAISNGSDGVYLDNTTATLLKMVSLLGTNIFADNTATGLSVVSESAIKANNLIALSNGDWGTYLDNTNATSAQPVTLTGSSQFKSNGILGVTGGLNVRSNGAISLNSITAINNNKDGALVENQISPFASNLTLTGTNLFLSNYNDGLEAHSLGVITLNNVTANKNGIITGSFSGYGARINNSASALKGVTLTGVNEFSENYDGGLKIDSAGPVKLNKITANGNQVGNGTTVDNTYSNTTYPQYVTLTTANISNGNSGIGLSVKSYGTITLANVSASDNGGIGALEGALLDNCLDIAGVCTTVTPKGIVLTGTNTFNNNLASGLLAKSKGSITLYNVFASGNGVNGALLTNQFSGALGNIVLNGTSEFSNNVDTGLDVHSNGSITLQNLKSYLNGLHGVHLDNFLGGGVGNVIVGTTKSGWCNGLSNNVESGLNILTNGTVTLYNMCNNGNGTGGTRGYGTLIHNETAGSPKAVNVYGSNSFNDNLDGGLYIISKGAITLTKVSAADNPTYGVWVNNTSSTKVSPQNVSITGYGRFLNNGDDGLYVNTYGAIILYNITANDNGQNADALTGWGANLDNIQSDTVTARGIVVYGTNIFKDNYHDGLWVTSWGTITLYNVFASGNGATGALLINQFLGATGNVGVYGTSEFSNNVGTGLEVRSNGSITLQNLNSSLNGNNLTGGNGVYLDNVSGGGAGNVVVGTTRSGWCNGLSNNVETGLAVNTKGTVTLYNMCNSGNGTDLAFSGYGALIHNETAGTPKNVYLYGSSSFNDNPDGGLYIFSKGAITLSKVSAADNATFGVWVDNTSSTNLSPQNVSITGYGRFLNNGDDGLYVNTYGAITLYNITANDNGQNANALTGWGANLDNVQSDTVTAKGIVVYGTNIFKGNYHDGLWATSWGTITANNLTTSWNTEGGVVFDNSSAPSGTPGVTLTGLNYFMGNAGDGLFISSIGAISLAKIHADDNGGNGVTVSTNSNITVSCGWMTGNVGFGWDFSLPAGKVVTLKGVYSYGNTGGDTNLSGGTLVTYRLCP